MDLTARLHDAPTVSVLVLLTGLVLLGPTVAVEAGLTAPFYEEPTVVVEPLEGGDELDVDSVPYDALTAGEQEISTWRSKPTGEPLERSRVPST